MKKKSSDKIVITGIGALTPISSDLSSISECIKYGKSGIKNLAHEHFKFSSVRHAGIVLDEYFVDNVNGNYWKQACHRASKFAIYATEQALIHAQFSEGYYNSSKIGIYLGSEPPGVELSVQVPLMNELAKSKQEINLLKLSEHNDKNNLIKIGLFPHLILSELSRLFKINGPAMLNLGTCSAAGQAIGESAKLLRNSDVDMMITGGVSTRIDPFSFARLIRVGALAPTSGDAEKMSCPFDKRRCGFTLSEGAVVFVLERLSSALERGVKPLVEIKGYGAALDGHSITDPHPDSLGMTFAMKRALEDAGLQPIAVDYINAHGTSTVKNDLLETAAIKTVFKNHTKDVNISSTKSIHGHLMSAAGAMEALVCILSMQGGYIPPTINYMEPDENCDLNYTPNEFKKKDISVCLSNSFGLGGQNCSLIFEKID